MKRLPDTLEATDLADYQREVDQQAELVRTLTMRLASAKRDLKRARANLDRARKRAR